MKKKEFGIIGLGKFGYFLGEALMQKGHTVLGLDSDPAKVSRAGDLLTQVFEADATDMTALSQVGMAELPQVVVSVGQSMEASILISLHLKELGCKEVWVKVVSEDHEKVLQRLGVDHVIFPERFAAEELAARMSVPGLIDYLPFGEGVLMKELAVKKWNGRSLVDLNLTNTHQVQVVALRRNGDKEFRFVPDPLEPLQEGDTLVVIGKQDSLATIEA
ncbi:MAG TPA: TrkA family potassium uptake protein [Desulfomicrobiaceae bacterium]|nr:TrkA family potassium uptake protein [Desulfomicrobiaceae bacterium]